MPHIIVEHTDGLDTDIPALLKKLHANLASQETVDIQTIKTRAIPVQHVILAHEETLGKMIAVTVKLLPGRPVELKHKMASDLHTVITTHLSDEVPDHGVKASVEVVELCADSYVQ